jgi:ADP-ribose pyrophosphatase
MADDARTEVLAEGSYLRMLRRDGWEYVERRGITGIVVIAAVTPDREIVLVEQYRIPVHSRCIELPAGLAGDRPGEESEPLAAAARRELLEETGYEASALELVVAGPISPGMSTESVSLFLARGLAKVGPGGGDESEDIIVHRVPLDRVEPWLASKATGGALVDPKVYTGVYFALRHDG